MGRRQHISYTRYLVLVSGGSTASTLSGSVAGIDDNAAAYTEGSKNGGSPASAPSGYLRHTTHRFLHRLYAHCYPQAVRDLSHSAQPSCIAVEGPRLLQALGRGIPCRRGFGADGSPPSQSIQAVRLVCRENQTPLGVFRGLKAANSITIQHRDCFT